MKYNFKTISPSDFLNLVNQEADPDMDTFQINYYKSGTNYFAHARTGLRNIITTQFNKGRDLTEEELEPIFDEMTRNITAQYEPLKPQQYSGPSFMSNPFKPGL